MRALLTIILLVSFVSASMGQSEPCIKLTLSSRQKVYRIGTFEGIEIKIDVANCSKESIVIDTLSYLGYEEEGATFFLRIFKLTNGKYQPYKVSKQDIGIIEHFDGDLELKRDHHHAFRFKLCPNYVITEKGSYRICACFRKYFAKFSTNYLINSNYIALSLK